jgi:DNA-binding PadR family transcriptional regulator
LCGCRGEGCAHQKLGIFRKYFRALHCEIRWQIIRLIGEEEKSTSEIREGLAELGEEPSKSGLYYHLSELEEAGIIELAEYREEGRGPPKKIWRLKTREININLLETAGELQD